MINKLCPECEKQLAAARERQAAAHSHLRARARPAAGRAANASGSDEPTMYECETCGALIEYWGAAKKEAAPFWIHRGWVGGIVE